MMIRRRSRIIMEALKEKLSSRRSTRLDKTGVMTSLTPAIIEWCDEMSAKEHIHRSQFIEETILDCHNNKSVVAGLVGLQDGCGKFLKSNKNRWGEGKKRCKIYLQTKTVALLEQLSEKTKVSKSECIEYMLRMLAEAIP
jgi:hypothetical protein